MKFLELHERLRLETWRRIDQGILSSSLLARQTGLAQAHISNFLHRRGALAFRLWTDCCARRRSSVEDLSPPGVSTLEAVEGSMDIVPIVSQLVAMSSPVIAPRAVLDSRAGPLRLAGAVFRLVAR